MSIQNPFGTVCFTQQPILKHYFQESWNSPVGTFSREKNLDIYTVPGLKQAVDVLDYKAYNSTIPVASFKQKVTGDFRFRWNDGTKGYYFFADWFKLVYDHEKDKVGILPDYIGEGEIMVFKQLKADDDPKPFCKVKLFDCWPSSVGPDDMDMASDGEIWSYSVTMQAADMEIIPM